MSEGDSNLSFANKPLLNGVTGTDANVMFNNAVNGANSTITNQSTITIAYKWC